MTGLEIIKRSKDYFPLKEQINGNMQVSYNDWGHLVLRFIQEDSSDCLIVLTQEATERVKSFINCFLNSRKVTNLHITNLNVDKLNDIPF